MRGSSKACAELQIGLIWRGGGGGGGTVETHQEANGTRRVRQTTATQQRGEEYDDDRCWLE